MSRWLMEFQLKRFETLWFFIKIVFLDLTFQCYTFVYYDQFWLKKLSCGFWHFVLECGFLIFLTIPKEIPKKVPKLDSIEAWYSIGSQEQSKVVLIYVPRIPKNIQSLLPWMFSRFSKRSQKRSQRIPIKIANVFNNTSKQIPKFPIINPKSCSIDGQWMSLQISIVFIICNTFIMSSQKSLYCYCSCPY